MTQGAPEIVVPERTAIGHYREAERLLGVNAGKRDDPSEALIIAAAQVHATLAAAGMTPDERAEIRQARLRIPERI